MYSHGAHPLDAFIRLQRQSAVAQRAIALARTRALSKKRVFILQSFTTSPNLLSMKHLRVKDFLFEILHPQWFVFRKVRHHGEGLKDKNQNFV